MWDWTIKKAEHWRIDTFELWCWRRLLRVSWTARRSYQSILKEISLEYSLEGLMEGKNWLIGKDPDAEKDRRWEEKGMTEDEMVGWHHQLPEFTQTNVHRVSNAIQPSHPLLSPSPPAFYLSQNQGLFQWVGSSHQMAKVLELHQSYQWIFRVGFL